jgi:hypothetical protein
MMFGMSITWLTSREQKVSPGSVWLCRSAPAAPLSGTLSYLIGILLVRAALQTKLTQLHNTLTAMK